MNAAVTEQTRLAVPGTANNLFTARQISVSLGKSKRTVQLALRRQRPDAQLTIRGQITDAWLIASLPARYVQEIDVIRNKKRYRSREEVLRNPPRRFAPRDANGREVPLSDICESYLTRAIRRMSALCDVTEVAHRLPFHKAVFRSG